MSDAVTALRAWMKRNDLDLFVVLSTDPYQNEYVPECYQRLTWLTGFTGSVGSAVVGLESAAFFCDGRYTVQAASQVDPAFQRFNVAELTPLRWVKNLGNAALRVGLDGWCFTEGQVKAWREIAEVVLCDENPVDGLWNNRPSFPDAPITLYPEIYAGEASDSKRARVLEVLRAESVDALFVTTPDSIAWLTNLRGSDVAYTPIFLAYALLSSESLCLFTHHLKVPAEAQVTRIALSDAELRAALVPYQGKRVMVDVNVAPMSLIALMQSLGIHVVGKADPCQQMKACKNAQQQQGMRDAHARDGAALTEFLQWFEREAPKGNLTEVTASNYLDGLRQRQNLFVSPSFATISGFAEHGAIVHYRAEEKTAKRILGNGLYLLDSGGQYMDGTTDVTRTVLVGEATAEQKRHFTLVLKGHIALARAVFPKGTTGAQLDVLARQFLWAEGLDYDHGTGHGVGSFLSVHEGPQRISKRGGDVALEVGMVLSNEPGFYKEGAYGIRIENLMMVVKKPEYSREGKVYLGFETLTRVPMDERLVEFLMLDEAEREWFSTYQSFARA